MNELRLVAERFFGDKWYPTERQLEALIDEAKRRGYFERWEMMEKQRELPWCAQRQAQVSATRRYRHETVIAGGKP